MSRFIEVKLTFLIKMSKTLIVENKKNQVVYYGIILVILVIIATMGVKEARFYFNKSLENKCVMQRTGCCGCEMGGKDECMNEAEALKIEERLEFECSKDIVCIAQYNCKNVDCKMIEGQCKEVPKS